MNASDDLCANSQRQAASLLVRARLDGPFALEAVHGGANSRAFRVVRPGQAPLFFKQYFRHPDDPRDRLGTEYAFACFAWQAGIRAIAQPLTVDHEQGCALFAFLEGRKLRPAEVAAEHVEQCGNFFRAINAHRDAADALPNASEACFSLESHWACLRRRLDRLGAISGNDALDRQAAAFVAGALVPAAQAYLRAARRSAAMLRLDCDAELPVQERCLSPSDFGFHNALAGPDGTLRFLDFEYAGWDDSAKTVCDFFCQPACPAPIAFYADFAGAIAALAPNPRRALQRIDLLLPAYRLKWCCIFLNDFLPSGAGRRRFAISQLDEAERKRRQLGKAEHALRQFHCGSAAA